MSRVPSLLKYGKSTSTLSSDMRLVCFHHAGGGASAFSAWQRLLPAEIELVRVQLPGREGDGENAFRHIKPLVMHLLPALQTLFDRPVAFYGHSLGAIVAFEALRELRNSGIDKAAGLFVSGRRAPQLPLSHPAYCLAPDEEFVGYLRQMGGIPEAIISKEHWRNRLFPIIRSDLQVSDLYKYNFGPPLSCPITVFGGKSDSFVKPFEYIAWQKQTSSSFRLFTLEGGHFFTRPEQKIVVDAICDHMRSRLGHVDQHDATQVAASF